VLPRKINNYLEYIAYQDTLWNTYQNAVEGQNEDIRSHLSEIYQKLMRHLEACYYKKLAGRGLLSEEEIKSLTNRILKKASGQY
jgi:preprotein translocase subunit SecA